MQFHITYNPPTPLNKNWPNGFWALYQINGDQIAERVVFKEIVKHENGAYYKGGVIARHSWPGYVGGFGSLDEVMAKIAELTKVQS